MINKIFKPILEALPENNRLERIWVLAKTGFLKRYYGSFLGVMWALINPLFHLAVYYIVFKVVFNTTQENFVLFLFLGLVLELFFAETSTVGIDLIRNKRYILENIRINWLDIYYAATLSTFYAFMFNLSICFLTSLFLDAVIDPQAIILFPLLVLNLLVFGFAAQVILSTIQVYLRDIVHLWDMLRMLILWFSGIFYAIDLTPGSSTAFLAYLTPLAGIVYNSRQILIYGQPVNWVLFAYDWIYALTLLSLALFIFSRYVRKALEKI
jgi:ABC-type polysaccharide/polyol phosphate export permease